MVSYGPDVQSLNYTHMYSFTDYRDTVGRQPCATNGTVFHYIVNHGEMKKFKSIVEMAMMEGYLNDSQFNSTIFIPLDRYISDNYIKQLDIGLAREIVKASILDRKINSDLLNSTPVTYYYTKNPLMRMYYTYLYGKSVINNCSTVLKYDINLSNGLIHIINGLIVPSEDHFMN